MIALLLVAMANVEPIDEVREEYEVLNRAYQTEVQIFENTVRRKRVEISNERDPIKQSRMQDRLDGYQRRIESLLEEIREVVERIRLRYIGNARPDLA